MNWPDFRRWRLQEDTVTIIAHVKDGMLYFDLEVRVGGMGFILLCSPGGRHCTRPNLREP